MRDFVRLDPADNVVTAVRPMQAGVAVEEVTTTALIPRGHKIATRPIARGDSTMLLPKLRLRSATGRRLFGSASGDNSGSGGKLSTPQKTAWASGEGGDVRRK